VWLQGPSGRGKTTLASTLCNILPRHKHTLNKLNIQVDTQWNPSLIISERCGVLFQQSTLLDELTVGGNLAAALNAVKYPPKNREQRIKQLLEMVGLQYHKDASKIPTELSGGMSRRASLALQLAQKKHVIFLDEPFTGLDREVAVSIAKELVHLRKTQKVAFVLISHEIEVAKMVMPDECVGNIICNLTEPQHDPDAHPSAEESSMIQKSSNIFYGTTFFQRFTTKLLDYFFYSLPLILLAFAACGLAISMLTCDTLRRIDVTSPVLNIVDKEIRPMIKMLTGQDASPLHLMGVRMKVTSMLKTTIPPAKSSLYAIGMAKLFVLEIGPLLTALLLCGRIGGSYAGKVATMQATSQLKLLQTLGISPMVWSFYPAICAAGFSGPMLTVVGTGVALFAGGKVGPFYGIGSSETYWEEVWDAIFPPLRLRMFAGDATSEGAHQSRNVAGYLLSTFSESYWDAVIEIVTHPPIYHFVKALSFMTIIMGVAEVCARARSNVTPRGVPR
jgi:ABC-type nitrate/sulfonate/bicarbonate transport system ATPase subunit